MTILLLSVRIVRRKETEEEKNAESAKEAGAWEAYVHDCKWDGIERKKKAQYAGVEYPLLKWEDSCGASLLLYGRECRSIRLRGSIF
jgi:hypothetical protein